jgi:putative ATPase
VGRGWDSAMADVMAHGSQPVPSHLLPASHPRMRQHGIGVGYRNPHDFDDDDVVQQYLPDRLADRRYWVPGDQGYEPTMAARHEARLAARESGSRRKPGR